MSVLGFIVKRMVALVLLVFILMTAAFVIFRVVPSDPVGMCISPRMPPDMREIITKQFALDRSLPYQYVFYLVNTFQGEMGISFSWAMPVAGTLGARVVFSLILFSGAFICAAVIDFLAASALARKSAIVNVAFFLTPFLFLGLPLILVFAFKLDLFPIGGAMSSEIWMLGMRTSVGEKLADIIYHLFLPAILLIIWLMVGFLPLVKATSAGVIQEKKALLPAGISTLVSASALFLGAMATESIFSWPGVYSTFVEASLNYDYPLCQGALVVGLLFSLVVAVCVEVFYAAAASYSSEPPLDKEKPL